MFKKMTTRIEEEEVQMNQTQRPIIKMDKKPSQSSTSFAANVNKQSKIDKGQENKWESHKLFPAGSNRRGSEVPLLEQQIKHDPKPGRIEMPLLKPLTENINSAKPEQKLKKAFPPEVPAKKEFNFTKVSPKPKPRNNQNKTEPPKLLPVPSSKGAKSESQTSKIENTDYKPKQMKNLFEEMMERRARQQN